jgi:delta14-sterol reductase
MSKAFETKEGPTLTLLLVTGFQLLYVVDYFWFEDGLLVTRDIVHEYLGYNLLVQFLMIPFCFAVQTRYLMMTGHTLPWYCLLTITILNSKLFIQESSTKTLIKESQKSLKLKFILAILFKPFGFLDTNHF